MTFKRDFALGKNGENLVLKIFKKNNLELELNIDKNKKSDYDALGKIGKKKFSIEIKFDYMAEKTNNLAIEYNNPVKDTPSGIAITKANLWCHIILDMGNPTVWLTSVKKLKQYIKDNKPWKIIDKAGDGNSSIYLYNDLTILYAIFSRIDMLNESDFTKKIKELLI